MKDKHIIFLNSAQDRGLDKVVNRALVSTGSEVRIFDAAPEAQKEIEAGHVDLVLINYDDADEATAHLAKELLTNAKELPTVLVSQKKDKAHLIELFSHERLRNLIARNGQVSEAEVIITVEKLLRQDIFGMDKYLTWGVNFAEEEVRDSAQKSQQIERVAEFVRSLKCDKRYVQQAEIVADEMLMNALYDAPVDENGKALYAHLPRTERVQLQPRQATLRYGSDGRYFAISCQDHFGALQAQSVVQYLRKCFSLDEYKVDVTKGGAGMGFHMIFQSISQLIINIDEGNLTETMGLIDIRPMFKEAKSRSKSFNMFVREK